MANHHLSLFILGIINYYISLYFEGIIPIGGRSMVLAFAFFWVAFETLDQDLRWRKCRSGKIVDVVRPFYFGYHLGYFIQIYTVYTTHLWFYWGWFSVLGLPQQQRNLMIVVTNLGRWSGDSNWGAPDEHGLYTDQYSAPQKIEIFLEVAVICKNSIVPQLIIIVFEFITFFRSWRLL